MFALSYNDPRPIYEQIKEQIKQMALTGVMSPDEQLPSVRELALKLAINPNTIQRAYKELENEGYIYSIRAKGSFVAPIENTTLKKHLAGLFSELDKIADELIIAGAGEEEVVKKIKERYAKGGTVND